MLGAIAAAAGNRRAIRGAVVVIGDIAIIAGFVWWLVHVVAANSVAFDDAAAINTITTVRAGVGVVAF